ncbi:transcription antitermination factor NusB [Desulfuromonas carbonis]|uniref:transcription antitermination factor NusB n=1 Tax=Desulfuromonas sp. DDH964 TaxID=1823759 RepID=UPI00078C91DD|nr:transcription antitermination factor NusB [Desulfuromonas sp. DDH964]AMV72187.1 transcription antitermination factor NusB [Desulfuromonas sp. DDH964]
MSKGLRRQGRELALKAIYGMHDGDAEPASFLRSFWSNFRFRDDVLGEAQEEPAGKVPEDVRIFTDELVTGTIENLERIDQVLGEYSTNWSLERMSRVDLALLRMACFELLYRSDVPSNVVINEAIEIGKTYGTKETPSFVNGILDKVSRTYRQVQQ